MSVQAPHLPYARLKSIGEEFLKKHHQAGYLPIPIEEIIEQDFNIDIVPMPGLKTTFDVDGFLTPDLTEIRVDQHIQAKVANRYRFSLAHELSHRLIHSGIYQTLKYTTVAGWKEAMASIPDDQYRLMEWQAYTLAGLILVPGVPLHDAFSDAVEIARKAGIELKGIDTNARKVIESNIAQQFHVSSEVIKRRAEREKLWG